MLFGEREIIIGEAFTKSWLHCSKCDGEVKILSKKSLRTVKLEKILKNIKNNINI